MRGGGAGALLNVEGGRDGRVGAARGGRLGVDRAGRLGDDRTGRLGTARGGAGGAAGGLAGDGLLGGGGGGAAGVEDVSRLGIEGGFPSAGGLPGRHAVSIVSLVPHRSNVPSWLDPAGFSLGIPPANSPASCGGPPPPEDEGPIAGAPMPPLPPPPPAPLGFSIMGALRSTVSAFLSFLPAWICLSSSDEAIYVGCEGCRVSWCKKSEMWTAARMFDAGGTR